MFWTITVLQSVNFWRVALDSINIIIENSEAYKYFRIKFKSVYNYLHSHMMGNKSFKKAGHTSALSLNSTSSSVPGKKDTFLVFLYKRIYHLLMKLWAKTKSMLWIGSTGKETII